MPRPLFKASAAPGNPDTLAVFVLYVNFVDETDANDEPGTTGRGLFGTDKDNAYALDPNGPALRSSRFYLEKHFEFARNYFSKVSDSGVVIQTRLFPPPAGDGRINPVQLSRRMKAYNPALEDKSQKQKIRDFESQRAQALMTFVSEAAGQFKIDPAAGFPFDSAAKEKTRHSTHWHPAFLIFHAGHSRLIDGGTLGFLGANTANDFTDFFVTRPDFHYLDSATTNFLPTGTPDPARRRDSLGVVIAPGDTITEFMMLSEAATQEKANWGINGILVNQLARQMGMPDLFDVVKGISQVGYFDAMDFAGYNTAAGFLPVIPSAWTRAFMGWDNPVVARPGTGAFSNFQLRAADKPGIGSRSVKIPLNEREYLLVENRQRAAGDSTVTIYFSERLNANDPTFGKDSSVTIPYSFLDSIFVDSVCTQWNGSRCQTKVPNPKRPRGVITGASHYDMGLPGNGLLVWHVNEWFLEAFLKEGAVNAYLGDTLRAQYKGLELVEADGIPSIGKEFTDPLGQPSFDYGTAQDLLPHIFRKRKNPPQDTTWAPPETLSTIGTYGFANTNSWNDGRTHIRLDAPVPAGAKLANGIGGFTGDSVFTLRDSTLTLRVWWPNDSTVRQPPSSSWPVRTAPAGNPQSVNFLQGGNGAGPYVVSVSDSGALQTYTARGRPALAARDTARDSSHYSDVKVLLASGNSRPENAGPVNSLVNPVGLPIGSCVLSDSTLAVLTSTSLRLIRTNPDSLSDSAIARTGGRETVISLRGAAGPLAFGGKVFAIDTQGILRGFDADGAPTDSVTMPARRYNSLALLLFGTVKEPQIVAVGEVGMAVRVDLLGRRALDLQPAWGSTRPDASEIFSVVTSDFDRDNQEDVFLLGSKGAALLFHTRADSAGRAFAGYPQRLPRSVILRDTAGTYPTEDRSPPALADLNRDGHPDILFSGTNAVFAIDWRGGFLPGWPFLPQANQSVGFAYANRRLPETVIGSAPLVLSLRGSPTVLLGSPDGLIYAIDSSGKRLSYSSFVPGQSQGVLMTDRSDWPLSVGGLSIDSARSPYVHLSLTQLDSGDLEMLAQTAAGGLYAWTLPRSAATPGRNWLLPGGDAGRTGHLDASTLAGFSMPTNREAIEEFHLFPSPLRNGLANVHLKIGANATKARIRVFDLAGNPVKEEFLPAMTSGLQPYNRVLDLRHLGPDVYSVLCEVWFTGGKKQKWQRIGVVK